jgi:predicted dehydrogenase
MPARHDVAGGRLLLAGIDELIALGLDYCVVAVSTIYHEQIALAFAAAGIHAPIQKPVTQLTHRRPARSAASSPPKD